MDRHSQFDVLPSYSRYSKHDIVRNHSKEADTEDSTYANIRKRLNSTVLSVPYEHKLEHFNVFSKKTHQGDGIHSHQNLRNGEHEPWRKPRSRVNSETESHLHESHTHHKVSRPRDLDGSQMSDRHLGTPSSTSSKFPRVRKDRAPSETSTTSTVSRPFSFSRYELDESFWMPNFREIEEIKERYAENSEFVASLHGFLEETTKKAKKKVAAMNSPSHSQQQHPPKHSKHSKSSSRDSSLSSKDITERYNGHIDHFSHKTSEVHQHQHEHLHPQRGQGRVILPAIHRPEEDTISVASTHGSMSSNASTIKNSKKHNHHKKSKYRKVEFNLYPKKQRPVLLPALKPSSVPKEDHHSKTPRSILKKHGSLESLDSSVFQNEEENRDSSTEEKQTTEERGNWDRHIPRLLSPIPASATRRNPVVFKNASNFHFNCSKEFKAVMGNIEDE